jgi:hypothetical protein
MENIHRIYIDADNKIIQFLKQNGVTETEGQISLTLNEKDELYQKIKTKLKNWKADDFIVSVFNEEEINEAKHLKWGATWQPLYPMPKEDFEYLNLTYDTLQYCTVCGSGARQKAPFRISNSPNWGKRSMFILHWVFDEVFCKKSLYEKVFKKYNIGQMQVLRYSGDRVLDDLVQLILPFANSELQLTKYPFKKCSKCRRIKYELINHGFFPSFKKPVQSDLHFFKSLEEFGSGLDSRKYIFMSQELRKELEALNIKSRYHPQSKED